MASRAVFLLAAFALAVAGACGGAEQGGSVAGADGSTKDAATKDAPLQLADVHGEEPDAESPTDGSVHEEEPTDAPACKDAPIGRTGTDVCVHAGGACQSACDCCYSAPFGTGCFNGFCYQNINM